MKITRQTIAHTNFAAGRKGHAIEAIVVHIMQGTMQGTLSWFRNPKSKVSAHYGVSLEGDVVQYVDDQDTAWHAGTVDNPTAQIVQKHPGVSPNVYTIGIEHEGFADHEPPHAQMAASAALIADLSRTHAIPLDEEHIIPHRAIRSSKTCPGKIDVRELIRMVRVRPGADEKQPQPGDRRFSPRLGENVILTWYSSDTDWKYLRESELTQMGHKAGAPWSALPATP